MKKTIALTLCALLTLSMTACGNTAKAEPAAQQETTEETIIGGDPNTWGPTEESNSETIEQVGIANPFVTGTMEESVKLAGFNFSIPDTIEGYDSRTIQAVENDMIQAIYYNQEDYKEITDEEFNQIDWENYDFSSKDLLIRKAKGSEDISGDYNEYSETNETTIKELQITTKGNNGKINVANWTNQDYTYAVDAANGLTSEQLTEIISNIE